MDAVPEMAVPTLVAIPLTTSHALPFFPDRAFARLLPKAEMLGRALFNADKIELTDPCNEEAPDSAALCKFLAYVLPAPIDASLIF